MLKYNSKWNLKGDLTTKVTIGQSYDYGNGLVKYFVVPRDGSSVLASEEYVREHYEEYKEKK